MTHLNLMRDPWLPVVGAAGPERVSLATALTRSPTIREFDGLGPPETVATLRLLVAILVDAVALQSNDEWGELWQQGCFNESLTTYLASEAEHFELFDDRHAFYQVADLAPLGASGIKPVALVMPEVASGNNTPLFSSLIDAQVPPLTPAEAAIRLITLQGFDTAAIKTGAQGDPLASAGKTTGNPTGPLGNLGAVMPMGRNLFETLLLNYPLVPPTDGDAPAWRRNLGPTWQRRPAVGILDLLTWQSRRVRLLPNAEGLVDRVIVAAGDRLDHTPLIEPHTLWRQVKEGPVALRPARHQPGRTPWRGLTCFLTLAPSADQPSTSGCLRQLGELEFDGFLDANYPLDVLSVGVVYGNMSAVVEDVISDRIPVPVMALADEQGRELRQSLIRVAATGDSVMNALNRLDGDLRRSLGGDPIPWDGGQRPGELFAAAMSGPVRRLLRALQQAAPDTDPVATWENEARRVAVSIAEPLLENAPDRAFLGFGEGSALINQAKAALFFWGALNKALPQAAHSNHPEEVPS